MSKIVVRYISGKNEIFDTLNFTSGEPYKQQGTNVVTDLLLRFDLLETEGLIAELYWYNGKVQNNTVREINSGLPSALRQPGCAIRLVSKEELKQLSSIELDGEMVAWKQGGSLINGVKFKAQELLCYSSDTTASLNKKALAIFDYLKKATEESGEQLSDEQIADIIGFPLEALERIRLAEQANEDSIEEDMFEDSDFDKESIDLNSLYENTASTLSVFEDDGAESEPSDAQDDTFNNSEYIEKFFNNSNKENLS